MDKKKKSLKKIIVAADAAVTLLLVAGYCIFFSSMNKADERQYVYIDDDDNIDSVIVKLDALCTPQSMLGFKLLASVTSYADHVRSGRYDVGDGKGAFNVFRRIKNGMQAPVNLTIPNVRTVERLAGALSKKLMMDSVTVLKALTDSAVCAKYHYTPQTIVCMFIPNTYDVYWNISTDKLLDRMDKESKRFWNDERTQKANDMKLTKEQVITLAMSVFLRSLVSSLLFRKSSMFPLLIKKLLPANTRFSWIQPHSVVAFFTSTELLTQGVLSFLPTRQTKLPA